MARERSNESWGFRTRIDRRACQCNSAADYAFDFLKGPQCTVETKQNKIKASCLRESDPFSPEPTKIWAGSEMATVRFWVENGVRRSFCIGL